MNRQSALGVVLLAFYFGFAALGCSGEVRLGCGNQVPIEFLLLVESGDCQNCTDLQFHSILSGSEGMAVSGSPLFLVESCELEELFVFPNVVILSISEQAFSRVKSGLERQELGSNRLLAVRVAGESEFSSLVRVTDLSESVPLLDLDSEEEIRMFLSLVQPSPDTVISSGHAIEKSNRSSIESLAGESQELLRRNERNFRVLSEMKRLVAAGGANSVEYKALLDELERGTSAD